MFSIASNRDMALFSRRSRSQIELNKTFEIQMNETISVAHSSGDAQQDTIS